MVLFTSRHVSAQRHWTKQTDKLNTKPNTKAKTTTFPTPTTTPPPPHTPNPQPPTPIKLDGDNIMAEVKLLMLRRYETMIIVFLWTNSCISCLSNFIGELLVTIIIHLKHTGTVTFFLGLFRGLRATNNTGWSAHMTYMIRYFNKDTLMLITLTSTFFLPSYHHVHINEHEFSEPLGCFFISQVE